MICTLPGPRRLTGLAELVGRFPVRARGLDDVLISHPLLPRGFGVYPPYLSVYEILPFFQGGFLSVLPTRLQALSLPTSLKQSDYISIPPDQVRFYIVVYTFLFRGHGQPGRQLEKQALFPLSCGLSKDGEAFSAMPVPWPGFKSKMSESPFLMPP